MNELSWISGGCPFKGRRIDGKGNVKHKGQMIVTSHELQFILSKPKSKTGNTIEKEVFQFKDIKSYGCHDNVLSIRLGSSQMGGQEQVNMVYFKLKEAVVVKELMDQVINMKKKPMPRLPSFDYGGGFYDMSPLTGANEPLTRKHSLPAMQENLSYFDPSNNAPNMHQNFDGYSMSRPMLERSLSATSTGSSSSSGPPSASFSGVYDNQLYQGDLVQYAQVEMGSDEIGSPKDPFSPPAISPGKKKFPLFKSKSMPKFGYTKVDIEVMEALREIDGLK